MKIFWLILGCHVTKNQKVCNYLGLALIPAGVVIGLAALAQELWEEKPVVSETIILVSSVHAN